MKLVYIATVTGFLLVGGAILIGIQRSADGPVYLTTPAERSKITTAITATGSVRAVVTVDVGSQLSGQVDALFVDFNDEVEQGQKLARIDQRTFIAKVREAEASLEATKSSVLIGLANVDRARSRLASEKAKVVVLQAKTASAKATLEGAKREFDRVQQLKSRGAVADRQFDEARAARDVAVADLREAEAASAVHTQEIATVEADLQRTEAELLNAQASVAQKESVLEQTRIELERTVIRSPIKGVVIDRDIDSGQTVAASLEAPTLFKIAQDLKEMEVHARIDEADIGRIRVGQQARFTVDAYPERQFSGWVTQIRGAPEVIQNVVTYTVVLATPNPELLLLPGMTSLVRIVVRETDPVLTIPNAALRFRPSQDLSLQERSAVQQSSNLDEANNVVWVLDDNQVPVPVRVQLGLSNNAVTEVSKGALEEGHRVVVGEASGDDNRRLFGIRLGF